ncbi:hypothetical protein A2U01_0102903, partial [Trifolium medium]|nr:hypothetical protein [Trifolium medium]
MVVGKEVTVEEGHGYLSDVSAAFGKCAVASAG